MQIPYLNIQQTLPTAALASMIHLLRVPRQALNTTATSVSDIMLLLVCE
jgi:hypothetical protein